MLKEVCHCGHDRLSHYVDADYQPPRAGVCLAMHCHCRKYVDRNEAQSAERPSRPNHVSWCRCRQCVAFSKAETYHPDDDEHHTPTLPYLGEFWP